MKEPTNIGELKAAGYDVMYNAPYKDEWWIIDKHTHQTLATIPSKKVKSFDVQAFITKFPPTPELSDKTKAKMAALYSIKAGKKGERTGWM